MVVDEVGEGQVDEPRSEVSLAEATDADIDAFINGFSQNEDPSDSSEDEGKNPEEEGKKAPDTQGQAVTGQEGKQQSDPAANPENPEEIAKVRAKNEQLRAALDKQTLLVQRRATEIGELRKALRERIALEESKLNENFLDDPGSAIDKKLQIKEHERNINALDQEEDSLKRRHASASVVAGLIPPEEFDVDAMARSLARDGVDGHYIEAFKKDPFSTADGPFLVQIAKRAHVEKLLRDVVGYAKSLETKVTELKGKPGEVLRNVERAVSKPKAMSGASGGSTAKGLPSNLDVSRMSDAELDEFVKRYRQEEDG